jgi:hypothetical protein
MSAVSTAVTADQSSTIHVSLLDRFRVCLAFQESKPGEKLAHNTVRSTFDNPGCGCCTAFPRAARMWMLLF